MNDLNQRQGFLDLIKARFRVCLPAWQVAPLPFEGGFSVWIRGSGEAAATLVGPVNILNTDLERDAETTIQEALKRFEGEIIGGTMGPGQMPEIRNGQVWRCRWPLCWEFIIQWCGVDQHGNRYGLLAVPGRHGPMMFRTEADGKWLHTEPELRALLARLGGVKTDKRVEVV